MDLRESRQQGRANEGEWYDDVRFSLLESLLEGRACQAVLDIGCGSAGLSHRLRSARDCAITGYDPEMGPADIDRLAEFRIRAISSLDGIPRGSFDVVLLMDVLEHVDEPQQLLLESASYVAPAGLLILSVPAYRWLWSSHDVALGHRDRYTVERLLELSGCLGSDFITLSRGYAFPSLLAGAAPVRLLERALRPLRRRPVIEDTETSQLTTLSPKAAQLMRTVASKDASLVSNRSPAGLTCVQVLERRNR